MHSDHRILLDQLTAAARAPTAVNAESHLGSK